MEAKFSWSPETPKRYLTIETHEYSCVYCGRGGDSKTDIFSMGACKHCGGPAKEYEKTTTLETVTNTGNKILLFDSYEDQADTTKLIESLKKRHKIDVVRFSSLVQNETSFSERLSIAQEAASAFGMVFFVPSEDINMREGQISQAAFNEARETQPQGYIKPLILLKNMARFEQMPRGSRRLASVSLNDENFAPGELDNVDDSQLVLSSSALDRTIAAFKRSRNLS